MTDTILNKFTLEEIYLIRSCNLKNPDKARIKKELKEYLELAGMKEAVESVIKKVEDASAEELTAVWEFSLD